MTFWWSVDNYGQILQAYALSRYLKNQGHEVEIIDYGYLSHPVMRFGEKLLKLVNGSRRYEKMYVRDFDRFRSKWLTFTPEKYSSVKKLLSHPPQADVLICGSDQIWHYRTFTLKRLIKRYTDAYMLDFGSEDTIRIAYAVSLGVTKIKPGEYGFISQRLKNFAGIGTREKASVSLLSPVCSTPVQWVPDPTMLLTREMFDELLTGENKKRIDFFVYSLGNKSVMRGREIVDVLKEKGKDYEYTACQFENDYEATCAPTVEAWLNLIKTADTVITNSFHGIVLSIIYHTNFHYYPLIAETTGEDTRITSLLERLGIADRVLRNKADFARVVDNPKVPIDWEAVSRKVEEFRKVGASFLEQALEVGMLQRIASGVNR